MMDMDLFLDYIGLGCRSDIPAGLYNFFCKHPQYIKDVIYSQLGPYLIGLTIAVWNIAGQWLCVAALTKNDIPILVAICLTVAESEP